ncbi:hypothetical protein GS597_01590 [Synechococcales cyanobacterium C]|uniref:Uncharacterized protein n=1 Tax=Petrachloros mirabilis ULC683 TaxID=2781853 RepID=A0A8K2A6G5_9CYAN|nr:hypothetical protein [Petrachloros mirabilis]NCJ05230.1 hypothetical protein [Petrachloros mirabilis ULC683]
MFEYNSNSFSRHFASQRYANGVAPWKIGREAVTDVDVLQGFVVAIAEVTP